MTKIDALKMAIATVTDADAVEILTKMLEGATRDEERAQARRDEQAAVREELFEILSGFSEPVTTTELVEATDYTSNKISALMRQLEAEGRVVIDRSGKKNTYRVA